jgi:hypothetical protein
MSVNYRGIGLCRAKREFDNEEHEAYIREHNDIRPDEDYEMKLRVSDRKKLWMLSGGKCSLCRCNLFQKESNTNFGAECHICSQEQDWPSKEFSRFDSSLTPDKRDKSYDNAILLCRNCHVIIDNPENTQYTIEALHQIKEKHEKEQTEEFKKLEREGKLQIIDIIPHENKTEGTCELEFQVKNIGGLNVLINHVNFKLLDIFPPNDVKLQSLEHLDYSYTYGLDISSLKQIGKDIDCRVVQIIKPDEIDRFKIVLIAKDMSGGEFRRWKLEPKLVTDSGEEVLGQPVEVWLPYVLWSRSFEEEMDRKLESLE